MTSSSFDIENSALSLFDVYSKVSILVILDGKCSGDQKCPYTKMNIYGQIKTNIHGHVNRYSHVRALYSREFTWVWYIHVSVAYSRKFTSARYIHVNSREWI